MFLCFKEQFMTLLRKSFFSLFFLVLGVDFEVDEVLVDKVSTYKIIKILSLSYESGFFLLEGGMLCPGATLFVEHKVYLNWNSWKLKISLVLNSCLKKAS